MWRTGLVAPWHVGSSQTRARTHVPCIGRRILNHCATRKVQLLGSYSFPLLSYTETGWDLGLLAAVLAPGQNIPSNNKIQRNYKGLKITTCVCSWGKLWTTRYKKPNTQLSLLKSREQKEGTAHASPPTTPPKGWASHLRHLSGPISGPAPTLTP